MKNRLNGIKLGLVVVALGFLSPSITSPVVDMTPDDKCSIEGWSMTLFYQAEAAPIHRQARRVSRRTSRRTSRRVNVRHNTRRYYGGGPGYGHGHHHHHGHPVLAFGAAVAVGSLIAAATMPPSCTTIMHQGISYKRCDGRYYKPVYQGDELVYKVVPSL
jgi:hypothetical protein